MKRKWIRFFLFCLLVLLLTIYFGRVLSTRQLEYINEECTTLTVTGLDQEAKNSLSMLFLGSSITRNSVLPAALWSAQGIPSYSLATPFQDARKGYYLLFYALRRQQPDVVIINPSYLFTAVNLPAQEPFVLLIYTAMRPSAAKLRLLLDYAKTVKKLSASNFIFPLSVYHDNIREVSAADFTLRDFFLPHLLKDVSVYTKQYQGETLSPFLQNSTQPVQLDAAGLAYFEKSLALCAAHGIQPVFVAPPRADGHWTAQHHELTAAYCQANGFPFLDMNTEAVLQAAGFNSLTDFLDAGTHINYSGQQKLSVYLGQYLSDMFNLPDHRGEAGYASWDSLPTPFAD